MQGFCNAQLPCLLNLNSKPCWHVKALGSHAQALLSEMQHWRRGMGRRGYWARWKLMPVVQLAPAAGIL